MTKYDAKNVFMYKISYKKINITSNFSLFMFQSSLDSRNVLSTGICYPFDIFITPLPKIYPFENYPSYILPSSNVNLPIPFISPFKNGP
jgi:hypothetical protein